MNEQLVVKNFGPIKDATVDFKRVTVFIGPTGGGKSTLAKLAAVFRDYSFLVPDVTIRTAIFKQFSLNNYFLAQTALIWEDADGKFAFNNKLEIVNKAKEGWKSTQQIDLLLRDKTKSILFEKITDAYSLAAKLNTDKKIPFDADELLEYISKLLDSTHEPLEPMYIPSERLFTAAIEYSWPGLLRDDIGLAKSILAFSNSFSLSRKSIPELDIPFLNIKYIHRNGQDFIKLPGVDTLFRLYETASGIQSTIPLLVLLEHLSRTTEQAQSFIIEEPELNLYPTAQQGILNWLVEKCTKGENDLTITTHSPYILSHLNLLLYAYQVGNKDEEKRAKVKAIIPEEYWINPDEFSAYYVNGPEGENGVRSLVDPGTKLISQNGLDTISGIQADQFDQLLDINSGY